MMRVLVTGATGFVGANLASRLLYEGHEVHIFVRDESNLWRLQPILQDLRLHQVNLQDQDQVMQAVSKIGPEWVMHLAVYGAYSYQSDLSQMIATNISGTANLLQACEQTGIEGFVNTGSSSEYGFKAQPTSETDRLEPNSYYAVTKAAATHLCRYTAQRVSIPITTLRLYSAYGPYEEPKRLIPTLLRHGLEARFPPLVSPDTARDFIYIDDVVNAYLITTQKRELPLGSVFNIGSGRQTQLRDVVQIVRDLLQITDEPQWSGMAQRIWDTNMWQANISNAQQELGWSPQISLKDGLQTTLDWLRSNFAFYSLES